MKTTPVMKVNSGRRPADEGRSSKPPPSEPTNMTIIALHNVQMAEISGGSDVNIARARCVVRSARPANKAGASISWKRGNAVEMADKIAVLV